MNKIILSESQFYFLVEQVGIDDFTVKIAETYPDSVYSLDFVVDFIRNSGCQKISISRLKYGAQGISLVNGVVINEEAFTFSFSTFLYILFHEVAHQYQYKKYGIDKMYDCYIGDIPVEETANWMLQIEKIADEFAARKIREMQQKFGDRYKLEEPKPVYKNVPVQHFIQLINLFKSEIKKQGYKNKEEISEILFNYVKNS